MQQLELAVKPKYRWGGRRPNAGRPKSGRRVGVPHRARPYHDRHHPEHVTWRVVPGLPSLRRKPIARAIGETIRASTARHRKRRTTFRVIHFSIQPNHLHLIVEAGSKPTLMRALRGLGVWIARRVNAAVASRGQVFADRYHARPLTTPTAMRNAIVYVLQNHRHHTPSRRLVDECSSARWFTGWAQSLPAPARPSPVARPATWLARSGWRRRHGPIRLGERPAT